MKRSFLKLVLQNYRTTITIMTNSHSKFKNEGLPADAEQMWRQGIGHTPTFNITGSVAGDYHIWCEDKDGVIHDPSPTLPEWKEYKPVLHYHKHADQEDWHLSQKEKEFIRATSLRELKNLYLNPQLRRCFYNAVAYRIANPRHRAKLKLVVGSQGFQAYGEGRIFWEFG